MSEVDTGKYIGIYPEWNVKVIDCSPVLSCNVIGIYPEWNVKPYW